MFYKNGCEKIHTVVTEIYPNALPFRCDDTVNKKDLPSHLLWMVNDMKKWDTNSIKRAAKAGRWIGWMFRALEELDVWNKGDSRKLSKRDVDEGYHLPH